MSKKYDTFAAYLEDVYYNQIFSKIKSYLFNNKGRLDLSTSVVPDPSYVELSDFKIMGVNFHESDTDRIECKVTVRAEIEISGRGRRDYESDSTECWISIPLSATLRNGLQQVSIGYASEYSRELFWAEDALTKYLVPYIYAKDLDKHAERFLEKYCPRALEEPMPLPIKEIVENMGLTVYHAPLPDGIFGRTYFNDANVEVFTNKTCSETEDRTICPGTILVNPDVVFMRNIGSTNNTVIHECVHWDKHYKFFELQKLLNPDIQAISCAVVEDYKKKSNELEDELSWMEWQANALAPKILIPAKTGKAKLSEILNRLHRAYRGRLRDGYVMELAISEFADFFKVSTTAAKIRAVELGFEQAAGVFNFVDGKNYPPFSFKKGSLKKGQTFVIDRNNVIIQSLLNPDLSEDIAARRFIHAGGLLVINDPQYVSIVEDSEPTLTEYALEHVDECCLVFDRTTRVSTQYDDSFYRICFLCRDADSKSFVEASFNPKEGKNEDVQKRAREMAAIAAEAKRVADILAEVPSSFCGTLDYHIKRRGYTNEKMEERTGISSRMIQDYRKKKDSNITLYKYSLGLVVGLILIGCGIFVFAKPQTIISVLPTVLGVVLLLDGLIKLQNAADMMKIHDKSWRYALIMCIVSAILGGLMLANPFKASEMLLKFIGIALIFNGVMDAIALLVLYNHVNKKEKKKMPDAAKDNQA